MIRQPLQRVLNPLGWCDYHAVAAPYRHEFERLPAAGRGAAGRHIAKLAFCTALDRMLALLPDDPVSAYLGVAQRAWQAFAADADYVVAMAREAFRLEEVEYVAEEAAFGAAQAGAA